MYYVPYRGVGIIFGSLSQEATNYEDELMSTSNADSDVFIYTGPGGAAVPRDVVRLCVDPRSLRHVNSPSCILWTQEVDRGGAV